MKNVIIDGVDFTRYSYRKIMETTRMDDVELIHIIRNDQIDCIHRGRIAVIHYVRRVQPPLIIGNPFQLAYMRSIAKPFQAMALVDAGTAAHYNLTSEELAIIAGSHNGTLYHTSLVERILDKIGLSPAALQCGAAAPLNKAAYEDLLLSGQRPTALHHNCSGKHAGMLATCQAKGWDIADYTRADHPVQQMILEEIMANADLTPDQVDLSPDGCGVPTFGIPLYHIAWLFAALGWLATGPNPDQVARAMQQYPLTYSGIQRLDADITRITKGKLIVKDGAEGIVGVAVPEYMVGIALKISDGNQRAIVPTLLGVLNHFHYITPDEAAEIEALYPPYILNQRGERAAQIQSVINL